MSETADSPTSFVVRTLLAAVVRYRARTLVAFGLVLLAKLVTVAVPAALKSIIDHLSTPGIPLVLPVFLLLSYALLRFLGTLFGEIRDLVFVRVTQNTVALFLQRAFSHLHQLSVRFHASRRTGALTRDVERGTAGIAFLLGVALFTVVPTIVEMAAIVIIMTLNYSDLFTVIILVTFAVYSVFTVVFTARREIYQRAMNELDSNANSRMVDSLLNYETVKYYTHERFENVRFGSVLDQWVEIGVNNQKALFALHVGQSGVIAVGVACVMLLAGESVVKGGMTVGDLVMINAYIIQICLPLNSLGFVFRQARDATVNAEKLFRLMEQKPEIEDTPELSDLAVDKGEVRFEHIDFSYDSRRPILSDVSFTIPPGKTVAVVGGSGSGKSTLVRLLFRFYESAAGSISIDGQDIREVSQKSLRDSIGIVPQDTILFNESIAYNIAYGREGATLADVIEAAKAAHVHEFISGLPQQYDTEVGERGVKLSGGEKQRIAIARALLKNPPIMVFDEATSALDTRSERAIQEELDRLASERTTLVIAHRLTTVVDADEILVLEHGRIVERGTHAQLLNEKGVYAQMWQLQRQQRELEQTENQLAVQPINLLAMLANIVDGLKTLIDERNMSFYSTVATDSARVIGDPGLLQHALWSLAVSSIMHTTPGGRFEMRIERHEFEGAGPNVRIGFVHSLSDLPAHNAKGANDMPVVLDAARVDEIIAQHHGRIERSPDAAGFMFVTVCLPLRATKQLAPQLISPTSPVLPAESSASQELNGIRVMVIDDTDQTRRDLESTLQLQGAECLAFSSGWAALQWLAEKPEPAWPDVLVCDIMLNEEDGHEIIQNLRNLEASRNFNLAEKLPAIAISAHPQRSGQIRTLLAGFQIHLKKPPDPSELVTAVRGLAGVRQEATYGIASSST
jgi:ATP-binding cassette, subfamily B, bacterial